MTSDLSSDQRETAVPPYARAAALMGRRVTTRSFRMECASCAGSGYSGYLLSEGTNTTPDRVCRGCNGDGYVYATETTVG